MVATACAGYFPTAVSPLSITASVPSMMALATSLASARVGRGLTIMDSSIWVAVTTGFPALLHAAISCFCTTGTSAGGSSTPRSPRATMIPSAASRMAGMWSSASGFSILAITGVLFPAPAMRSLTARTSSARRTKDRAIQSTPWARPNSRSASSFSVRAELPPPRGG